MDLGIQGRRALVTGGSKGIGLAIADELAREGVDVAICARTQSEVQDAAAALGRHGVRIEYEAVDVTDASAVERFVGETARKFGGLDILVNNAGGASPGNFETLTDEAWQRDIEVKLFSQVRCSRAALRHLRASVAPRIVNINAVYARHPDPKFFATTVNRAACLNLSKALAIELGPEGVLVNSVNIGFVTTPQWENIRRLRDPDSSMETFTTTLAAAEVPLGRFGMPEEVAGLVAFLASDRASYITGASIDVAGGMESMSEIEEAVRNYYQTVDTQGADETVNLFTEDATYRRPGYGEIQGREALERFYGGERVIASGRHILDEILVEGTRAAVQGRFQGILRDGCEVEVGFADFLHYRGILISARTTYFYQPSV